jgi:uncharacterized protein (TIGR03083 family)
VDDVGGRYAEGRRRISEIAEALSPEELRLPVPACPGWTVHDVVAHLAGICTDVLAGNLDGVTTAAWADAHVRARRDRTMAELLDEWSVAAPRIERTAARFPEELGTFWVLDVTAHEHDLRGAVGRAGARNTPALLGATEFLVKEGLHRQLVGMGLGGLVVHTPGGSWSIGGHGGSPQQSPVVACSAFDLFRALTGRRSPAQIARFDWSVDPAPFVPAFEFGTFTMRTTDLEE